MPIDLERRLAKVGDSYRIVIPIEVIKYLNLKAGDILKINTDDHRIVMEKKGQK